MKDDGMPFLELSIVSRRFKNLFIRVRVAGARQLGRRGFSFTEVLFAVMVLGIGFIMIAAIFPVAIKQTQATMEETVASTMAKGAVSYLARNATLVTMPSLGVCRAVGPDKTPLLWQQIGANLINPADPRCGWVCAYMHATLPNGQLASFAQVVVVCAQTRNAGSYSSAVDLAAQGPTGRANLELRPFTAVFTPGTLGSPDMIALAALNPLDPNVLQAPVENAYVIVSDDQPSGIANGWIYRLGVSHGFDATGRKLFERAPGDDTAGSAYKPQNANVLILGAGLTDPAALADGYSGVAQDVAVYTTFVSVH